ncbi:MAG: SufD family Fe-S cluster assembly protein [Cyanobacteriota bacterium]|nr:SufD family Fe-S cluster assembly protein [Cyanobacteriota bacterium]
MVATPLAHRAQAGAAAAAWEALAGAPLPTRRQEDWRFSDPAGFSQLLPRIWSGVDPWAALRLPAGVTRLDPDLAQRHSVAVLQQTRCSDHWPVRLNAGAGPALLPLQVSAADGELVLDLDAVARAEVLAVKVVLLLEPGAQLDLVLRLHASGSSFTSVVVAAELAAGASLRLAAVGAGHHDASLLAHCAAVQHPSSSLQLTTASAGWGFSRLEPRVVQVGGAASTRLRALQWVGEGQLADTHSLVRFEGPEGSLDQVHKVVATGTGRSVFNGAVQVPREAQRTNASQLSRSLLLSDRARIDTKPELEIVADDVKCAHGATISQLQSEELFYLRSRGIAEAQAARLLLDGYCQEVLAELPAAAASWQPLAQCLQGA